MPPSCGTLSFPGRVVLPDLTTDARELHFQPGAVFNKGLAATAVPATNPVPTAALKKWYISAIDDGDLKAKEDAAGGLPVVELTDVVGEIKRIIEEEKKTPLLLDDSEDRKLATFFSFKGVLVDGTKLALPLRNKARPKPKAFMEELRARVDAYGSKSVAEALEEVDVALPPGSEILSGCHSSKERRLAKKGRDPFLARVTTICTGGQYVHKLVDPTTDPPTVVEERLEPEAVLHLRSAGADYEYVFPDSELKGTKNDILGMGVSLVIGSAVRAAFERYFEPDLELSDGGSLLGRS